MWPPAPASLPAWVPAGPGRLGDRLSVTAILPGAVFRGRVDGCLVTRPRLGPSGCLEHWVATLTSWLL